MAWSNNKNGSNNYRAGVSAANLGGDTLDWTIIEAELTPLAMLKEQPEIMEKLFILRSQYQSNR